VQGHQERCPCTSYCPRPRRVPGTGAETAIVGITAPSAGDPHWRVHPARNGIGVPVGDGVGRPAGGERAGRPGWPRGGSVSPSARPGGPWRRCPQRATGSPRSAVAKGCAGGPAGLHPAGLRLRGHMPSAERDAWLPVGVVPAAVCLALTWGCNGTSALVGDRLTGLLGDRLATLMPAAWPGTRGPVTVPSHVVAAGSLSPRRMSRSRVNISTARCPTTAPAGPGRRASQTGR
jgi:hypothetical protein